MGSTPTWFVVLPDREIHPDVMRRLRQRALQLVAHPSGRPWLVGAWSPGELTVVAAGEVRLAVAGTCSLTTEELTERARRVRGLAAVESELSKAHGSFHVIASVGGHTYVRGTLSGERRVYLASVEGGTVCADRARTLAWLTSAELDAAQLAVRLTGFTAPHPLAGGGLWRGVHGVVPGEALHLEPGGQWHTAWWWQAPESELPLAEAAPALRQALRAAVALRVRPGEVLGADLSGGMDSTSLCFLAAEAGARLVAATLHWTAPGNEDHVYARHASEHLPSAEHLLFPSAELPAHFTGLDDRRDAGDEPSAGLRDRAQQHHLAEAMRLRGAVRRLSGHGGDHVVQPPDAYLHGLLRRSPLVGLRHAAGLRARRRWRLTAGVRMLLDRRSYGSWLAGTAGQLRAAPARGAVCAPQGWGLRPQLPPWASDQAADLLGELLRAAARDAEPLAAERGQHAWIRQAQEAGRIAGHLAFETVAAGLPAHSPFCDDAVINACLAARPHEAATPWSYKPLLAAAMDGLVPARILRRTTKDHCGVEWQQGLRLHRRDLAAWAEDSRLVAAGVADEELLRRVLLSPGLLRGGAPSLESTLGAEAWLRDLEAQPVPAHLSRPGVARPDPDRVDRSAPSTSTRTEEHHVEPTTF
ncbi:asparagine synthase-related protein [Streptantibioticus ferralitis]|uniref:Asparagine synthase-related protein n=1 Tax=Streptantibioticus ferralitis TaxID=236510 RepID=A0ABT5YVF2_9ACTN|nr:asparagine synthase-related protein [Streptantibioticus ferralitis]MDF2255582.1 asparagine synthase-related protein [Streptantibioticus ferralitis]